MEEKYIPRIENVLCLVFSTYDFPEISPQEFSKEYNLRYKKYRWIPQTLGDCVWIFIDFNTIESKNLFIKEIESTKYKKAITSRFAQKDINYWW